MLDPPRVMVTAGLKMYKASHLLVKHRDVRNPSSWKEKTVTRSPEEALSVVKAFREQLASGDPQTLPQRFAELASKESHCSSAKRGGDLGEFRHALVMLQSPVEI
jgi:peptidyl-prolyl cis-trans isomerase NIMA-interacting 1